MTPRTLAEIARAAAVGSSDRPVAATQDAIAAACREYAAPLVAALKAVVRDHGQCCVPEKPCASLGITRPSQMCAACHATAALAAAEGE